MGKVGYQDGLKAAYERIKKIDPGGCNPKYDPDHPDALPVDQLKAWDKVHRTLKIIKEDHDAAIPSDPPPPNGGNGGGNEPPPNRPWESGFAPQAYNQGGSGQDARYNIRINCTQRSDGKYVDGQGIVYDDGGRPLGGRTQTAIPELKPADQMDGREPWDIYVYNDVQIGPNKENYPVASYNR